MSEETAPKPDASVALKPFRPSTPKELKERAGELGERARDAGIKPVKDMITTYVHKVFDAAEGFLRGLEGKDEEDEEKKEGE